MQQTSKMEFFLIVSILALPAILFAQLTGIISDELLYPPDYDFFQQPYDVQTSYNDPVFGTEIKRVTNNIHFDRECLGGYFTNSEPNYFNLDGSYFLAMENDWVNGELEIITYLYNGNTGERIKTIGMEPLRNWWIRWAINDFYTQDGDTVYFDPVYHFYKYEGNEIRLYDVRDMTFVLLHRFDEYEYIGPGGGEGDLSGDGRFWLLDGEAEELFVYDLIDDIKYPASTFDLGSLGSFGSAVGVDYACISPSGQYAVVSWTTEPAANQQFHGIEVYDKNWNYLRQVYPGIVHWEMGIDAYGDEVIYTAVSFGMTEYWAPWGVQGGDLVSIRLVDGAVRLLKNMPKWAHFTLSSSNAPTPQDYIYVSYDDNSEDLLDWWFPFWGEIFELPTDGSGIIRRLVHHRTRPVDGRNEKYYQADINVNRQKTKCIYRSTYNTEIGDIYMFDIGNRTGAADVIQPLSPLQLTSTDSTETSIDLAWQAPPPAPDGDGGSHYRVYRDGNLVGVTVQTTFTDTQLSAGEYYSYEVYAWDDAGNQSATAASASFRTDGMPPGVFDEEFDISLSNYVKYIPNSGPEMSIREREGFMRLQVPSSSVYDHWTSKDLAPQLQRPVENEDWIVETRMELTQVSGIKYHAGLMVWFSQYDLFYWGFTENTGTLYMSRSGSHGLLTAAFTGGSVVDLRIRREGPIYYFDYKAPGDLDWITAGSDAATGIPVNIGVIAKTWGYVSLILDFDYLRLYSGTVVSVLTTSLPGGQENVAYSQQLAASGGTTPYTWNVIDGALPGGLSLSATGEICGSPVAAGDYFFTVQVTDNSAPATSGSRELSIGITALEPLEILTQSLAGGYVGVSYSDQVSAGGGVGPYTWAVTSGALPPGLFLNPSTGAIDGTPIISGISVFEMTVTDSQNPPQTAEKALSTEVTDLPYLDEEFDSGSLNGYTVYIPKSGPEINSTTRPDFLRFSLPSTSAYDHWDGKDFSPQLRRPLDPGDFQIETKCELTAAGGSKYHTGLMVWFSQYDVIYWGYSEGTASLKMSRPKLHGLISVNYGGGTGVELRIRRQGNTWYFDYRAPGAPVWTTAGNYTTSDVPVDAGLIVKTWALIPMTVDFDYLRLTGSELAVNTTALPDGQVALAYNAQLQGSGGMAPYLWSVSSGQLPSGLALNPSTGVINGIPLQSETADFTVLVTDSETPAGTATADLSITVDPIPPLQVSTTSCPDAYLNQPYSTQLSAEGGLAPYTWGLSSGALPAGLSLNQQTGEISGTATQPGTFNFVAQVTDSQNPPQTAVKALSIEVTDLPYLDEEFAGGSLNGYTVYIPKSGPEINSTTRPDFLRFSLPSTSTYDHWDGKDFSPQLRRPLDPGDFQIETKCELTAAGGSKYHTGLLVWFSQYDVIYWGYSEGTTSLKMSRPKLHGLISVNYGGRTGVELRIRRQGNTWYFDFRAPGAPVWTTAGNYTTSDVPVDAGLIVKTWALIPMTVDFDYLRLTGSELAVNTTALPDGQVALAYNAQLQASGGVAPYQWDLEDGTLPPGLSLAANGAVSGTPGQAGLYTATFRVVDSAVPPAQDTKQLSININTIPDVEIATTTVPNAVIGRSYDATLSAQGGITPYSWTVLSGALPNGLTLHNTTGALAGVPTVEGQYNFRVQVQDVQVPADTDTMDYSLSVTQAPPIDEEFETGSLDGYDIHIPYPGPSVTLDEQPGYLRIDMPANKALDHWLNKDNAPQIRRDVGGNDWQMETRVQISNVLGDKFHAGLMVWFSQYDLFYWGFKVSKFGLGLDRTGELGLLNIFYNGGYIVDLQIRKQGNVFYFDYKTPDSQNWTNAGSYTTSDVPTKVGLIVKTWAIMGLTADFDYLRLLDTAASSKSTAMTDHYFQLEPVRLPEHFSISECYPNPFNPVTRIELALVDDCHVVVIIYNVKGQIVKTIDKGALQSGVHPIEWAGTDDTGFKVQSGVYFLNIYVDQDVYHRKALLMK